MIHAFLSTYITAVYKAQTAKTRPQIFDFLIPVKNCAQIENVYQYQLAL